MSFFSRLANGWKMAIASFKVINKNRSMIWFPIISGTVLLIVSASFFGGVFAATGFDMDQIMEDQPALYYSLAFAFYIVSYFIIIFFNMGLVHCARLFHEGEKPTFNDGFQFSLRKTGPIFGWAVVAATVGLILKIIEDQSDRIGQIVAGLLGVAWSIMTFFVIPVIAYEDVNPIQAVGRSTKIMKEKWGESLGANFSFGIISMLAILIIAGGIGFLLAQINVILGIAVGVSLALLIHAIVSAAEMVFVATVYHHATDKPVKDFDVDTLDGAFASKS